MGSASSKPEKQTYVFPEGAFFGLENFGNTCYVNSVLQSLYHCRPFRDRLLEDYESRLSRESNATAVIRVAGASDRHSDGREKLIVYQQSLLFSLAKLFFVLKSQKKSTGVIAPTEFIEKLRKENVLFRSLMQNDAQEFFHFLLNDCAELLEKEEKQMRNCANEPGQSKNSNEYDEGRSSEVKTWLHSIFEGVLSNETRCLCCKTVTHRDEKFLDLSLEVEQNTSVSACLRNFASLKLYLVWINSIATRAAPCRMLRSACVSSACQGFSYFISSDSSTLTKLGTLKSCIIELFSPTN